MASSEHPKIQRTLDRPSMTECGCPSGSSMENGENTAHTRSAIDDGMWVHVQIAGEWTTVPRTIRLPENGGTTTIKRENDATEEKWAGLA